MRPDRPTRRRVITIFAAAAASALTGGLARPREPDYAWRGAAMGADATILFSGVEPETARRAIAIAATEIERLEGALSLFRDDFGITAPEPREGASLAKRRLAPRARLGA